MAYLARAVEPPKLTSNCAHQDAQSGSDRAWKRFFEDDVVLRMPGALVRRLETYARQINVQHPDLNASATKIAYVLLNWALDHQQLMDTDMDMIGAALAAEGNRANQALELLRESLQELEAFDARQLMPEVAELERLHHDLSELCVCLKRLSDAT